LLLNSRANVSEICQNAKARAVSSALYGIESSICNRPTVKRLLRSAVNVLPYDVRRSIRFIPGVAALQRFLVNRILAGGSFVHNINAGPCSGLRFEVALPQDKAIWAGTYEPEFTTAIISNVRPGDVCYDIGGFRGYMAGAMALAGASKVVVFEPLPVNQKALERLLELNPSLPIAIMPVAIGNEDGLARFTTMPDASMGKLASSSFQTLAASTAKMQVSVCRLDTLVQKQEIPPPNLIKVDVEGAELDVLQGAAAVLKEARPFVFLEAHSESLEQGCTERLTQLGYAVHRMEPHVEDTEHTRHLACVPDRASSM
jgi:FkbM family methyltransferase